MNRQIVKATARNVKGIHYVEIFPRDLTIVGGKNGQGKSSLLDAIAYTLGGASLCPEAPIRHGETEATCEIELSGDQKFLVKRRWYTGEDGEVKTTLTIKTPEGHTVGSPQAVLDRITGKLGFDPCRFMSLPKREQLQQLQQLLGIDPKPLNDKKKSIYDERAATNRLLNLERTRQRDMPTFPEVAGSVSVEEMTQELLQLEQANKAARDEQAKLRARVREASVIVQQSQEEVRGAQRRVDGARKDVEALRQRLREAEEALESERVSHMKAAASLAKAEESAQEAEKFLASYVPVILSPGPIVEKIAHAENLNAKWNANVAAQRQLQTVERLEAESKRLTGLMEAIDEEMMALMKKASWPVEGLGMNEESVTYKGIPFSQLSAAEQRLVAFSVGLKSCKSPFVFIHDGSLLDEDSLDHFARMAAEAHVQLFVERVGSGSECHIVIEGGVVKLSQQGYVVAG
ncbi:MAG: hypothetical protein E6Q97_17250 [Desulfurellales bacterium]|nr:MAG: hypothetical protein E6Q97_17250 [Desulfurellales bacterium]